MIKCNKIKEKSTLIALVVTLIIILILAAVGLSSVFSDKGVFSRAENAGAKYNEAKAREVLETVLMTDGQMEKHTNPKYNQDDFLDKLIKSEIEGSDVKGDIAIVGGYAYELDRSVPKIGRYLGNASDLVWPTVNATVELASDKENATINITVKEEKNGINKIEIWLLGEKIKEYTYDNIKTEVTVNPPYIATQNGKYTIKAYGDLMASTTVEVTGIMPGIEFEPNGNTTWEKEHSTKIKVQETEEKIKSMKYQWTNSVTEPVDNTFTEICNDGDTISKNGVTGQYYLWVLLETENGTIAKRRSEAFKFDNEGPNITSFTATKYSETGITLSATAQDNKSSIVKFEFYVDNVLKGTETCTATTSSISKSKTITGLSTGSHSCKVIVYDAKNNNSTKTTSGSTKLYVWDTYNVNTATKYVKDSGYINTTISQENYSSLNVTNEVSFNEDYGFGTNATTNMFFGGWWQYDSWRSKKYAVFSNMVYVQYTGNNSVTGTTGKKYYVYDVKKYTCSRKTVYIKGTNRNSVIASPNINQYPVNGNLNNIWYVRRNKPE